MTDRKAKQRRLERAGFRYYEGGWLPEKNPAGPAFAAQVEAFRDDIVAIVTEPAKPRGRPSATEATERVAEATERVAEA